MGMYMLWSPATPEELPAIIALDPDGIAEWLDTDRKWIEVEKSWWAIHTTLTGTELPEGHELDGVVLGGTAFCEELEYGPPHYATADEVAVLASLLDRITVEDFKARIDLPLLGRLAI